MTLLVDLAVAFRGPPPPSAAPSRTTSARSSEIAASDGRHGDAALLRRFPSKSFAAALSLGCAATAASCRGALRPQGNSRSLIPHLFRSIHHRLLFLPYILRTGELLIAWDDQTALSK
ncbi:hypothetical protein B296_00042811 [Ensete ventricosum]|uniref:Uncharacterized protein n=1 Tax=Ensete ventricosum TaxID=4639 RepID=A0A426ZH33_ENSVE|nr:hypothetical protein B296_00042811 [Ensete ventricosum]